MNTTTISVVPSFQLSRRGATGLNIPKDVKDKEVTSLALPLAGLSTPRGRFPGGVSTHRSGAPTHRSQYGSINNYGSTHYGSTHGSTHYGSTHYGSTHVSMHGSESGYPDNESVSSRPKGKSSKLMKMLKMKALRKKMWWDYRHKMDEYGFIQEISVEEYEEYRKKNKSEFLDKFPSIIWQETRSENLIRAEQEKERVVAKAKKKEEEERKKRTEEELEFKRSFDAFNEQTVADLNLIDEISIRKLAVDKLKVERLEVFERDREATFQKQKRIDTEAAAAVARMRQEAQEKAEAKRIADEIKAKAEKELYEKQWIAKLLRQTGVHAGIPKKDFNTSTPAGVLVVEFEATQEGSEDIGVTSAQNLWAVVGYIRRFPTAVDHSRKFPQFFNPLTRTLQANNLNEKGGEGLGIALRAGIVPRLAKLDIAWNKIGRKGCMFLGKALSEPVCMHLTHIVLDGNNLRNEGAKLISQSLSKGKDTVPKLQRLDLRNNFIGNAGALAVAHLIFLDTAPLLETIQLDQNRIQDLGGKGLVKAGRTNKTIKCLSLKRNMISASVSRTLGIHATFLCL